MPLASATKEKYLLRIDELIKVAEYLPRDSCQRLTSVNMLDGSRTYATDHFLKYAEFVEWRTSASSILDAVVPLSSIHRAAVDNFPGLSNKISTRDYGISFLKSIRHDLENDYFDSIYSEVDAEISFEYLTQAENLLQFSRPTDKGEVAAAVIAGAVLEHGLRKLCTTLVPVEPIEAGGKSLTLSGLIEALKKRKSFNELTAKQLRAWADIRNAAAHGRFEDFDRHQVESMVSGITDFLARHG